MLSRHTVAAVACLATLAACGSNVAVRTQAAPGFTNQGRSTFRVLPNPRRADGVTLPDDDPMLSNSITQPGSADRR